MNRQGTATVRGLTVQSLPLTANQPVHLQLDAKQTIEVPIAFTAPQCPCSPRLAHVPFLMSITSVQLPLPVWRHAAGRSRHGLVERVLARRSQERALEILLCRVVPEPLLARLVALDDRMSPADGVVTRMLRWRRVATTDMAAMRTAAQMEPPSA